MKRQTILFLFLIMPAITVRAQEEAATSPVFVVSPDESNISFYVKASVALKGVFDKWSAVLTCDSTDPKTCVLDLKVQADSVNTGSGMKDGKLKSKAFFDVKVNPLITFRSTKVVQDGPDAFDITGVFTIRGVSKPETLIMTAAREGNGGGIKGQMAFDRKEYGMTSGIPFIKIADRVEVNANLKVKRVSGPALALKQ